MKKTKVLVFAALLTGGVCMQAQEAALPKQIKINAERKSKVDDNTARMQSIKQLGV